MVTTKWLLLDLRDLLWSCTTWSFACIAMVSRKWLPVVWKRVCCCRQRWSIEYLKMVSREWLSVGPIHVSRCRIQWTSGCIDMVSRKWMSVESTRLYALGKNVQTFACGTMDSWKFRWLRKSEIYLYVVFWYQSHRNVNQYIYHRTFYRLFLWLLRFRSTSIVYRSDPHACSWMKWVATPKIRT